MKNLLNLDGVKALSKMEQKLVTGGLHELTHEGQVVMTCGNGTVVTVENGSCSEWSMHYHCQGNGDATICVGPLG